MEENTGMFIMWIIVCLLLALIGKNRKIGYGWSLVICLFLSPLIGLIVMLCSKKKGTEYVDMSKK
ncbi:MAG: hypothetical protein J6P44_06435 [Bacteroidales bacterium]|nr:hypothetical protein [Bacteroidales bacterium]